MTGVAQQPSGAVPSLVVVWVIVTVQTNLLEQIDLRGHGYLSFLQIVTL